MSHKNDSEIFKLSYESLNDQRLTGLGCDLYIVSSNGIGFPAHASVVCSQSDVFQVRNCNNIKGSKREPIKYFLATERGRQSLSCSNVQTKWP